jgi:RNA polymerase sigma factor (sigma-70 family)
MRLRRVPSDGSSAMVHHPQELSQDTRDTPRDTGREGDFPHDDGAWVDEFLAGRPEGVKRVASWARSVAAHGAWGFETPEDVVQATLLAVFSNLRDGRFTGGDFRAYVRRIAKNMCITDYRRLKTRGEHVSLDDLDGVPDSNASGERAERLSTLDRILGRLQENCRQIIVLAYVEGFSRKEIGERLGISEEAARVKLFRCIQNARGMVDASDRSVPQDGC